MNDVFFFIENRDIPARPLNCPLILFFLFLTYLFLSKILEHLIIWRGPHPLDSNYFLSACLFLFLTPWLLGIALPFLKTKTIVVAFSSTYPATLPVVGFLVSLEAKFGWDPGDQRGSMASLCQVPLPRVGSQNGRPRIPRLVEWYGGCLVVVWWWLNVKSGREVWFFYFLFFVCVKKEATTRGV